jgi:hypothetical protein
MAIVGHYRRQIIKMIMWWKNTPSVHPSTEWMSIFDIFNVYIYKLFLALSFDWSFQHYKHSIK